MTEPARAEGPEQSRKKRPCAVLGVVAAPGLAKEVTALIAAELLVDLRERHDSVDSRTELEVGRLVVPPAQLTSREQSLAPQRAREVARLLATGTWTHDHPLQPTELELLGLPVRVGIGDEERELLDLYPQPRGREAAVEYVPAAPGGRRGDVRDQPRR